MSLVYPPTLSAESDIIVKMGMNPFFLKSPVNSLAQCQG